MKRYAIKHGRYEHIRIGCDWCGEPVRAVGWPHPIKQWHHIYLCKICWPIMQEAERK